MEFHSQDKIEKLQQEIIQEVEDNYVGTDFVVSSSRQIIESDSRRKDTEYDSLHVNVVVDSRLTGSKPDCCYTIEADSDFVVLHCMKEIKEV